MHDCTMVLPDAIFTVRTYRVRLRPRISTQINSSQTTNCEVSASHSRSRPKRGPRQVYLAVRLEPGYAGRDASVIGRGAGV
jgi:hypothetical protein